MHSDTRKIIAAILGIGTLLVLGLFSGSLFENLGANELMVIQSPVKGELTWHTTPGVKWQGFGKVTAYPRRSQFTFTAGKTHEGETPDTGPIKVRFNDGAHATLSGSLSWEMPLAIPMLTDLHTKYSNYEAVEAQLIKPVLDKALYMTGPLMTSAESYASRRTELLGFIDDQFRNGVYKTTTRDERQTDQITGQSKTVKIVQPVVGPDGKITREEISPIAALGVGVFNLTLSIIEYEAVVEEQIRQQQESVMAVQLAIADGKRAEQEILTTKAKGEAEAAKAEWEQRKLMATETTKAQQEKEVALTAAAKELEVAQLATQAAEQVKLAAILKGEGEAMARQLVMTADGALEKKLEAWILVNSEYAKAIGTYTGNWVPSVQFGQSGFGTDSPAAGGGSQELISLLTAKTAKDLAIDMTIPKEAGKLPPITRPEMSDYKFVPSASNASTRPNIPQNRPVPASQVKQ